jgi:hypothetical protein
MSMHWGEVPGDSVRDRAVRLAGALAELAQRELLLSQVGVLTPVHARVTDLPGMIDLPFQSIRVCGKLPRPKSLICSAPSFIVNRQPATHSAWLYGSSGNG